MASDSAEAELSAVERWIDSTTGKPKYSRFTEHNLPGANSRCGAVKAAAALNVPYYRAYGRHKGLQPIPTSKRRP
ncbi:hypothetical protein E4U34_004942 [Claviceps purpurea]|nr:hypothetical protein E4U34_004942 [Claviceps purpurea]